MTTGLKLDNLFVDMLKLLISFWMNTSLQALLVGLKALAGLLQKFSNKIMAGFETPAC
jgi:hypothetical protein